MDDIKRLALETILLSMEELKTNLVKFDDEDTIVYNAFAIKLLADAFEKIAGADTGADI